MVKQETIINLIAFIFGFILVLILLAISLSLIGKYKGIPEIYCKETGGQLVFYECQNIPFATPCSQLKTGYWCDYPNGESINVTEIWSRINSTV